MDNYMREQCDIFLQSLEVQIITQVTTMINTVKTEMYKEINKIVTEFKSPPSDSFVSTDLSSNGSLTSSVKSVSVHKPTDAVISDVDGDFTLTRKQRNRIKRREKRSKMSSAGTSSDTSVAGFSGKAPDVFIYRCSTDTKAEIIKDNLTNKGIQIKSVELYSHKDAATNSFKVSVETLEDFDKLLSRDFTPRFVKVKKFIYYRDHKSDKRSWHHTPRNSSCMNHPNVNVASMSILSSPSVSNSSFVFHHNDKASSISSVSNQLIDPVKLQPAITDKVIKSGNIDIYRITEL